MGSLLTKWSRDRDMVSKRLRHWEWDTRPAVVSGCFCTGKWISEPRESAVTAALAISSAMCNGIQPEHSRRPFTCLSRAIQRLPPTTNTAATTITLQQHPRDKSLLPQNPIWQNLLSAAVCQIVTDTFCIFFCFTRKFVCVLLAAAFVSHGVSSYRRRKVVCQSHVQWAHARLSWIF